MALPAQFVDMLRGFGPAYSAPLLAALDTAPSVSVRANTLKGLQAKDKADPVPWCEAGFYLSSRPLFAADPAWHQGLYYVQDASSMVYDTVVRTLVARYFADTSSLRYLDACAAPGGKSIAALEALPSDALLVANEYDGHRANILLENLTKAGAPNVAVSRGDACAYRRLPEAFDIIAVDAPCSGEGMFKKEPLSVSGWSMENVIYCARRQAEILENAARMLRGGGTLVYSTCTFSKEENEGQIAAFLNRHSEFEAVQTHALYPHEVRGEGHFAAVLKKKAGECGSAKQFAVQTNKGAERAFADFAKDFFAESKLPFLGTISTLADGRMYLIPEGIPDFGGIRVLRAGIELGEWDGKLFKPAHALAMCLSGGKAAKFVSLGIEQSETYLRGDTVECALANGWCVVGVEEFPLGMGKIVNGRVKNHLPKGLRKIK